MIPRRILIAALAALSSFAIAPLSQATNTLLGETLTFQYLVPDKSTVSNNFLGFGTRTVTAGTGDQLTITTIAATPIFSINPEATSINLDFLTTIQFNITGGPNPFNGLGVSGFNMTPLLASEWSVNTNIAGWNVSHFTVESNRLLVDFQGLQMTTDSFLTINLTPTAGVPDTGSTLLLLGGALLGLVGVTHVIRLRQVA